MSVVDTDWTVEVDINWRTWSAGDVRAIPPPGTRRNARRPTDDLELVRRIKMTAEASQEAPRSSIWLASLALPTPHGKKPEGVRLRAETFSIMYRYAVKLGLSPKRAIHAVYGLELVEAPNERALPRRTLGRARRSWSTATGSPAAMGWGPAAAGYALARYHSWEAVAWPPGISRKGAQLSSPKVAVTARFSLR